MDTRPLIVKQKLFRVVRSRIGPDGKRYFGQEYSIYATTLESIAQVDEAVARKAAHKLVSLPYRSTQCGSQ